MPLPEPFRAKTIEAIHLLPRNDRERLLTAAGFNVFALPSDAVYIDLLTDSGTGALSDRQWAAMMTGDEAYAGSRSFEQFRATVAELLGFPYVIPTHQGRGAEHVLDEAIVKPGDVVPGNAHFDTTKAHIEVRGARAIDCTISESTTIDSRHAFKGNVDVARLESTLAIHEGRVAYVLVTLTCNTRGGQPVSMENIEQVSKVARSRKIPLFLDIARFAENAWFIKTREQGYADRSVAEISRSMMDLADGVLMSAKKNALVNIGGFIALRDEALYERCVPFAVLYEGFLTYGGLAGRDLAAMAVGLREGLDERHLAHRIAQVRHLADRLQEAGVPIVTPPGGHAVSIDADAFFPHLSRAELPAQTLVCELYLEGGVRTVEVGTVLAGRNADSAESVRSPPELVRLAIPARVYSAAHLDYVADVVARVFARRDGVRGLAFVKETPILRHFTSTFRRLA